MCQASWEGKEHGKFWPFNDKENTKGPSSQYEEHKFDFRSTFECKIL